jgi:hypothetical protein
MCDVWVNPMRGRCYVVYILLSCALRPEARAQLGPFVGPTVSAPKHPVLVRPKTADKRPVIVAVHGHGQVAARAICNSLARLSRDMYWIVCPWGERDVSPYPYYRFSSSTQAEHQIRKGLAELNSTKADQVRQQARILVGEDDGAVLVTRVAGRNPTGYPRLVLIMANRSTLVSDQGTRVWSRPDLQAFARHGGRAVLYVLKNCKNENRCPGVEKLCGPLTALNVKCERLSIPQERQFSSDDSSAHANDEGIPTSVIAQFSAALDRVLENN